MHVCKTKKFQLAKVNITNDMKISLYAYGTQVGLHSSIWQNPAEITVAKTFEHNKLHLCLLWQPIETLHDVE